MLFSLFYFWKKQKEHKEEGTRRREEMLYCVQNSLSECEIETE